uniref:tRNA-uridine aminocarboxypropyltransferase 1 n=1 Tax=Parastrongyloides trichosuri TaxID=131310 RepID=A0A0N4ZJ78_PARTI
MSNKFKLSDDSEIRKLKERVKCRICQKKRLYFCYDCHEYCDGIGELAPKVELPIKVDIIKHKLERNGKSTAVMCKITAPESTKIFTPDDCPNYNEEMKNQNIVLVFPSKTAVPIKKYIEKNGPIDKFVFLDSTWQQTGSLRNIKELSKMPHVSMKSYKTEYWRPQHKFGDEYLATIEAIYYANKEAWEANNPDKVYDGFFDNLLFWFYFFRSFKEISKIGELSEIRKKINSSVSDNSSHNKDSVVLSRMSSNNSSRSSASSQFVETKIKIQEPFFPPTNLQSELNHSSRKSISKENSVEKRRARLNMPLLYRMYESQSEDIRGTVSGPETPNFHPEEVSKTLRKALVGITTDDKTIISSIFLHTNFQRQMICKAYESMYERNLIHDIEEETGGFFMELCIALLRPTHVFSTQILMDSFTLKNQDVSIAVEIACTCTNPQLRVIKETYTSTTSRSLDKDILNKIEGICGKFLQALYVKPREDDDVINEEIIKENLNLIQSTSNFFEELGRNVELFGKLFVSPSFATIHDMIETYDLKKEPGKDFESLLRKNKNLHTEIRNIILLIIKISKNTQEYFADKLHDAISGARADHNAIIRIVVMRSETDLADIVEQYVRKYGHSPLHWLQKTCSGDYFRLLSAMLSINGVSTF